MPVGVNALPNRLHTMAWRRGWVAVASAVLALSSCSETNTFPPAPHVVPVSMTEYRYGYEPPSSPGRIVFEARNVGRLDHELVLISVPEDIPPIDQQLRSDKRLVVPTVARLAPRGPGHRGTFAVDLEPGRYALVCFVKDADGAQHDKKGMSAEFTIKG